MRNRIPKLRWLFLALITALVGWHFSRPLVTIHYSADAPESIGYIYNENNYIHRGVLKPGQVVGFLTPMFPNADSSVIVDVPMRYTATEIKPPFSRADVYIDAAGRLSVEKKEGFLERFSRSNLSRRDDS